jgi:hypothetical protein
MRNLMIGMAALAAVGIAMPATTPANAETVKKVIIKKRGGDDGVRKKVVIKHGDRGNHYGWRNRNRSRVVIKRRVRDDNVGYVRREGGTSVTIKKKIERD